MASLHCVCQIPFEMCSVLIKRSKLPRIRAAFVLTLSLSSHVGLTMSNRRSNRWSDMRSICGSFLQCGVKENELMIWNRWVELQTHMCATRASVMLANAHEALIRTGRLSSWIILIAASIVFSMKQISTNEFTPSEKDESHSTESRTHLHVVMEIMRKSPWHVRLTHKLVAPHRSTIIPTTTR